MKNTTHEPQNESNGKMNENSLNSSNAAYNGQGSTYYSSEGSRLLATSDQSIDLICLSHLRWDFVYQRPQHLLSRCAGERRVFFFEEPIFSSERIPRLDISQRECGVWVAVPHLPEGLSEEEVHKMQSELLSDLVEEFNVNSYILWFYTPMAIPFTRHLEPAAVVYDCMDELSMFKNAPQALKDHEKELFGKADLVFTGGQSLYESKKHQHHSVHAFPSSIDYSHFAQARAITQEPPDQVSIAYPRIGFFGVIDERLDIELLDGVAKARPDWQLVMIGPVVKIDPNHLPKHSNIHYLGAKSYNELPLYLAGWNVAMLPFAKNDSTRFISPTKTPEYLAAGKPVVSTSIKDVVRPYGEERMVHIADTVSEFIQAAAEAGMDEEQDRENWLQKVDSFLSQTSWDKTWSKMSQLINAVVESRVSVQKPSELPSVLSSQSQKNSNYNRYAY